MFSSSNLNVGPISNETTLPPTDFARLKDVSPENKNLNYNRLLA